MLVLPLEYLVFKENESSIKKSFSIMWHKLDSTATVAKSFEDLFASWLADVHFQPVYAYLTLELHSNFMFR